MSEAHEVLFTLKVGGQREAAASLEKTADGAGRVSRALEDVERQSRRAGRATQEAFNPWAVAQERINKATRESAVQAAQRQIEGLNSPRPSAMGQFFSSQVGRVASGVGAGYAVGAYVQGLGQFASEQAARPHESGAQTLDRALGALASKIPILGQIVDGVGQLLQATNGLARTVAFNLQSLGEAGRLSSADVGAHGIRMGGIADLADADRRQGNAAIAAAGSRAFQATLDPWELARFRPRPRFGEATESTGDIRFGVAQAQVEADIAQQQLEQERLRSGTLSGAAGLGGLADQIAAGRGAAGNADAAAMLAQQRGISRRTSTGARIGLGLVTKDFSAAGASIDNNTRLEGDQSNTAAKAAAAYGALSDSLAKYGQAAGVAKGAINALAEAEANAASKSKALADAKIAETRDRLAIVSQQVGAGRAGAAFAGASRPGELEATAAAIRQAKQYGIESLTDPQRGLIGGFGPAGQDFLQRQFEQRGRGLPGFNEVQGLLGQKPLNALEGEQAGLQDAIRTAGVRAEAEFRGNISTIYADSFQKLSPIILEIIQTGIDRLAVELRREGLHEQIQGQQRQ